MNRCLAIFLTLLILSADNIYAALNLISGNNSYVDLGNPASLQITSDITLAAWINPSSIGGGIFRPIIGKRGGAGGYELYMPSDNTGHLSYFNGTQFISSFVIPTNTWTHVAAVVKSGTLSLYANGGVVLSNTGAAPTSATGNTYIGLALATEATFKYSGIVDDVRILNRALSSSEIMTLFSSKQHVLITDSCAGWWKFDEGFVNNTAVGTGTILDSCQNRNNGSPVNGPIYYPGILTYP